MALTVVNPDMTKSHLTLMVLPEPNDSVDRAVIVADDLTGACDAAVYFAETGRRTYTGLHFDAHPPADCEVFSINSDTRCSSPAEAAARTAHACENARKWGARRIVKKIDSMMRGNIAAELAAARAVLQPRITLLTPAFPALGRIVRDGKLHIDGGGLPIGIAGHLAGLRCAAIPALPKQELGIRFAQAIEQGIEVLIPDTLSESGLRTVVEASAGIDGLLWAGSGGLAQAIASTLGPVSKSRTAVASTRKPLLLCVGSDHVVTLQQLSHLKNQEHAAIVNAGCDGYRMANAALDRQRNVVLLLERKQLETATLREFAKSIRIDLCGGLILTGGDTALHILDALETKSIRSCAEVLPGIPQGEICGGAADGLPVVTKSGAFGAPDALSHCIRRLSAAPENTVHDNRKRLQKETIR